MGKPNVKSNEYINDFLLKKYKEHKGIPVLLLIILISLLLIFGDEMYGYYLGVACIVMLSFWFSEGVLIVCVLRGIEIKEPKQEKIAVDVKEESGN